MRRSLYLALFVLLALAAGGLVVHDQRTVDVVVAAHDLRAGMQVQGSDVEIHRMHADGLPAGTLTRIDDAVGHYVGWPLAGGEAVLARALRDQRSGGAVSGGLAVPSGFRAVAVQVQPAAAVGGMLSAGDRVDVYATPLPGHQTASSVTATTPAIGAGAELIGRDVLVLQLRSDQGQALNGDGGEAVHGLNFGSGKLGSVVLAVPDNDVVRFASATAGETIYLALSLS